MKNYIRYYYNLVVENLSFAKNKYIFTSNGERYIFKENCNDDLSLYYDRLSSELIKYKFFLEIIPNIDNSLITFIENNSYILLKDSYDFCNNKISIFDMKTDIFINYYDDFFCLKKFQWIDLWKNKIDYLEMWIKEKKNKYRKIYSVINYFLGISENALLYLKETLMKEVPEKNDRLSVQHNRVDIDDYLCDYYDPTSIILDHHSRDISEYIKSLGVNGKFEITLFENYLENNHFSKYGAMVMYSRILFPTFFYDFIEEFATKKTSSVMLELETKIKNYQELLLQVSRVLFNKYMIECPDWIFNVN